MEIAVALATFFQNLPPPTTTTLRVLVAISGGADSLSLLHALRDFAKNQPAIAIEAAHFNHLIRVESAADAIFVAACCQDWQIKLYQTEFDVPDYARTQHLSLEAAARRARYSYFAHLISRHNFDLLLTAHTASDQAETILLHLLRGSGLHGLTGMATLAPLPPPDPELADLSEYEQKLIAHVQLGRPLLKIWRNQIEAYCTANRLAPRQDDSNQDTAYLRNRLRHQLLPVLEKDYQAQVSQKLVQLGDLLRDEDIWLNDLTESAFANAKIYEIPARIEFSRFWLANQPIALQRRLMRRAYQQLRASLQGLEAQHLQIVLEKIALGQAFGPFDLPNQIIIEGNSVTVALIDKNKLIVANTIAQSEEITLTIPGKTTWCGWLFETEIREIEHDSNFAKNSNHSNFTVWLNLDTIAHNLNVRSRQAGERFRPLGATGRRKVQDIMLDARILPSLRAVWPVVVRTDKPQAIVWLPGVAIAHDFRQTADTCRVLILKAQPL